MNDVLTTMDVYGRELWGRIRRGFAHAFALRRQDSRIDPEDLVLLDHFARLLADRGLATPAIFLIESLVPLGFLASQLVHALTPIMGMVARPDDIERLARLLEREETPALFIDRLRREEESAWREMRIPPVQGERTARVGVRGTGNEGNSHES